MVDQTPIRNTNLVLERREQENKTPVIGNLMLTPRTELIADLEEFAALLRRRPNIPIGEFDRVRIQYSITANFGDEAARIAEVERVAAILGVEVERDAHAVRARFEDCGRVEAESSYVGAVQPETVSAR